MVRQQNFAELGLPALYRALDLIRLEQRRIGMHGDLELARRGLVNVIGERHQVLAVEVTSGVGGGQIPFGLGRCAKSKARCSQGKRRSKCSLEVHEKLR